MALTGRYVWRDFVSDGIPSSGKNKPLKREIRDWTTWLESLLGAVIAAGGKLYTSLAAMNADLTPDADTPALVVGDTTVANNGLYVKVGAAGTGSWSRVGDVPGYQFVRAENAGAGTPNAIVAASALPISNGVLVYMPIDETNTASPVTVSFNGNAALTIKTVSGSDPVAGGLPGGMVALGVVSGSIFRLVSDQASAAIVAAAEGWAIIAQAAANGNLSFATRASAIVANINASIHSVTLKGDLAEGDGLGGLFVDTNNGNPNTFVSADSRTWYRVVSSNPKLFEFGAKGDGVTLDDVAVAAAVATGKVVDGQGLTYAVASLPSDFSKFRNAAFLFDGKLFRTDDYLDVTKYRVTKTLLYTDWTQDKACQFQGAWILPFQLAHGHTYDTTRIAWSWSFDKGQTWQEPEIILDKHPTSPTLGWNCFSAGVIGNRFVMFAEERQESNSALLRVIMRDILLDRTYYRSNGIALTAGSSIATIPLPNHGLIIGDQVSFSGVSGTDVAGLSGQKSVYAVLDKDRFQVDKGSASASNQSSTGGSSWIFAHTYYNNVFRETVLDNAMLQNGVGQMPTHIHSLTVKDAANGEFFIGFHNGSSSPREVGVIHVQSFFGTPTFVKRRIPSAFEGSGAEPCLRYSAGRLHMTTRGQSASAEGSSFGYSDDDGVAWTFYRFPGNLHYSPLPFEFYDGEVFIFGSERGENEWNAGSPDNRYNINRPRSFMLRVPYTELVAGNFGNMTTTLLGYEIYQGEQVSSGVGVGSTLLDEDEGKLIYAFSSEDMRSSTRYSLNLPSVDNEFLGQGYQPDVYAYEISLKKPRAGNIGYELRGPDLQTLPVYKQGNTRRIEGPLRIVGDMTVAATLTASKLISGDTELAVNERVCPTAVVAAATLALPAGYSVYKITPPSSGAGAVNVTAIARTGTKEGDIITLVTASVGDAVIVNNTGFFRIGANRSLSSIAKVLTLQRAPSSYWHLKSWADN